MGLRDAGAQKEAPDKPPGITTLVRGARQLLTLRAPGGRRGPRRGPDLNDLGIIPDGALLLRDGKVLQLGPTRRLENLVEARKAEELNVAGRVVMPGFVDSHTHLPFPPSNAVPGGPADAARAVLTSSASLLAARIRPHLEAMARHGTTTVEAKSGAGDNQRAELKILRSMAGLSTVPVDLLRSYRMLSLDHGAFSEMEAASKAMRVISELLPLIRRRGLAFCADLEWEPRPALYPIFIRYLEAARLLGLQRKVQDHHESASGSVLAAVENGALSIDHLARADPAEVRLLARSPTLVTLLPATILFGGGLPAPARELIDAGVAVAMASNFNPVDSPIFNLQTIVWMACRHLELSPAEAISAATINGAHALGVGDRVGSLERGKAADLLVLNVGDYRELGRSLGGNLVQLTMKGGHTVYREREVKPRPVESPM